MDKKISVFKKFTQVKNWRKSKKIEYCHILPEETQTEVPTLPQTEETNKIGTNISTIIAEEVRNSIPEQSQENS
jgi:hypothetical protein